MNVEGDFRYVDSGAFDECTDFLEYLEDCEQNWEEAFLNWFGVSERWKDERKVSQSYWGPWNLVKVWCIPGILFFTCSMHINLLFLLSSLCS